MKIKSIFLAVFFVISFFLIQSCNTTNDGIDPNNNTTSRIQLKLVDAPGDYDQVWVDIINVQYNRNDDDAGWTSFEGFPVVEGTHMIDLTELIAESTHILADEEIESGMLSKVRLVLGGNNYLILEGEDDEVGEEIPLKTPSAQQSGLKLHLDTELVAGYSYTFILDWDVQKSIVKAGNSGIYNLKPVIHVIAEANSGTLFGRIADTDETDTEPMPLEAAITLYAPGDTDFLNPGQNTSSNDEGLFMLPGVPEGDYLVRVTHDDYDDETRIVTVVNGQDTEANFLLIKSTGSISGRVADSTEESPGNLKPLGDATVKVYANTNPLGDMLDEVQTSNADDATKGTFSVENLLPGKYILKVTLDTYDEGSSGEIEVIINAETDAGTILLTKTPV